MSSLIPCYEYDIFISYRQKDNKHDGWVTEFVSQLKGELEATFKEDISIYFDENPHDGLLETHNVDKSLEGKLSCLIFIPIISQTYCDPKSYAWQHEFCTFKKLAKEDKFGKDIKLSSGNVASRILPVKIHDLDPEDRTLLENELGGQLRGIEFIYKEAGVNRPLKPNDEAKDNLSRTSYRNQVNKVANAVKEIITALKKQSKHPEEISKQDIEIISLHKRNLRTKITRGSILAIALIVLGIVFIPKLFNPKEELEKSIAVLPFINESPVDSNKYFINGIMEEILNNLMKINDLRVLGRTSTSKYQSSIRPTMSEIAKKLGVSYLVEGSGQKYGNKFVLRVQLIAGKKERHLWGRSFEQEIQGTTDLFGIQREIAHSIAVELKAVITPKEEQLIEKSHTASLPAYDLYLKANEFQKNYEKSHDLSSYYTAINFYKAALLIDSTFARAYVGLAFTFTHRYYWLNYFNEDFLDSCLILARKALSFDDQLDEAYSLRGMYYFHNGEYSKALIDLDKALALNPNYYQAYYIKGNIFSYYLFDFVKSIGTFNKALDRIQGDERPGLLRTIGNTYGDIGFTAKGKYYHQEAFTLDGDSATYYNYLSGLEWNLENFKEALEYKQKAIKMGYTYGPDDLVQLSITGQDQEAYILAEKSIEQFKKSGALSLYWSHRIGYAFHQAGKREEASYFFNEQIKFDTESIGLRRDIANTKAAHYDLAGTYAFLGNKNKAYQYLDEFNTMSVFPLWWITLIKHDPLFKSIRHEERFQKILQNMESKYQAEHERVRKWLEEQGMQSKELINFV